MVGDPVRQTERQHQDSQRQGQAGRLPPPTWRAPRVPSSRRPYRANLHALNQLGVEGSRYHGGGGPQAKIKPGDFVVSDQFVNFTNGRKDTFFDGPGRHT